MFFKINETTSEPPKYSCFKLMEHGLEIFIATLLLKEKT